MLPQLETLATKYEETQTKTLERESLAAVQQEYGKYFEAAGKPARMLVGQEVPSLTGPGMERLRDSADARDWQEAVKQMLVGEVESRVEKARDAQRDVSTAIHASIELFRNNTDLIPGTAEFDKDLADAFASQVKDYVVKGPNGKIVGYMVPVQPIINALRAQLAATRTAATAAPAAAAGAAEQAAAATATARQAAAAAQARAADGRFEAPQAGVRSQAGRSADPSEGDEAAGVLGAFFRQNGVQF